METSIEITMYDKRGERGNGISSSDNQMAYMGDWSQYMLNDLSSHLKIVTKEINKRKNMSKKQFKLYMESIHE